MTWKSEIQHGHYNRIHRTNVPDFNCVSTTSYRRAQNRNDMAAPPADPEPETYLPATASSATVAREDRDRFRRHPSAKEPSQKRRRVGDEGEGEATFRHFAYVLQTKAACLMFCCEQKNYYNRFSVATAATALLDTSLKTHVLAVLPREIVALVGRFVVAAAEHCAPVVRFSPSNLQSVENLPMSHTCTGDFSLTAVASQDGETRFLAGERGRVVEVFDLDSREYVTTAAGAAATQYVRGISSYVDDVGASVVIVGLCDLGSASDSEAVLWEVARRRLVGRLSFGEAGPPFVLVCFRSATGVPFLASGHNLGRVQLWNLRTRTLTATLCEDVDLEVFSLCAFRDSSGADFIVSGTDAIMVWEVANCRSVHHLVPRQCVDAVACFTSGDGVPMLVSASSRRKDDRGVGSYDIVDSVFTVWDLALGLEIVTFQGSLSVVSLFSSLVCVAGADGRVLLAACSTDEIVLIDLSTEGVVFRFLISIADADCRDVVAYVDHKTGSSVLAFIADDPDDADFIQLWSSPLVIV
jgi:hypothetical protein